MFFTSSKVKLCRCFASQWCHRTIVAVLRRAALLFRRFFGVPFPLPIIIHSLTTWLWRHRSPRICTWKNSIQTSIFRVSTSWCALAAVVRSRSETGACTMGWGWVYEKSGKMCGEWRVRHHAGWVKLPKVDSAAGFCTLCAEKIPCENGSLQRIQMYMSSIQALSFSECAWNREMLYGFRS